MRSLTSARCCLLLITFSAVVSILGCGAAEHSSATAPTSKAMNETKSAARDAAAMGDQVAMARGDDRMVSATPRRVIYNADVAMQTREFAKAERVIPQLVKQLGGYLTDISLSRQQGEQRSGRWQARVPAESFHEFLDGLDDIGVPERRQVSGQYVTEEFVDLEVRLANKKKLEERLLDLMKAKSASVADVIEFERQVGSVREEIERMEGRFRYLTNRSELSSVTISLREVHEYVPPQEPTFATRLDDTWGSTLGTFRSWGEGLVIGGLRSLPWLAATIVVGLLAMILRRIVKSSSSLRSRA